MSIGLSPSQIEDYRRDGYVIVRSLCDPDVAAFGVTQCEQDARFKSGFAVWSYPPDDVFGLISRADTLVTSMEQMLDGEVYHYQSKVMSKQHNNRGAFEWHQDYGYWYRFALMYPLLASCMVSFNGASRSNGCLQVLKGSHQLGRVDHVHVGGGQMAAEPERVEQALRRFECVHVEMEPGDAILFHCNLLHASSPNESGRPRWTLICCYNAARNDPYQDYSVTLHPRYSRLEKISDAAIADYCRAKSAEHTVHA
jgi:ectoine hydroxylase-related dioxygenase (phytanoyl-CoA dioxygenase family)